VASQPASETVPAELRLELWARAQIVDAGLAIEGWARVRASDPPTGPLVLIGRADGAEVLVESLPETDARTQRERGAEPGTPVTRTLPFRLSLKRDLGAARELWLEATWGGWRSEPLRIEIPDG
jgi:hypothetical protein